MDLTAKTNDELSQLITNYERAPNGRAHPQYAQLLEERARRKLRSETLDIEKSLECLKAAAHKGVCVSYGELAAASKADWAKTRHQMNGPSGHLDRLADLCHARGLPLLPALCVNQENLTRGELGEAALKGFTDCARRLGHAVENDRAFHHQCRDACWAWGRTHP